MDHPEGESMRVGFDEGIQLEFHGAKVTSDGGFLAHRDLDDAIEFTKLIKIGAKVDRHSRYSTFRMTEVTVDKRLFSEILSRIERLRSYSFLTTLLFELILWIRVSQMGYFTVYQAYT